MGRFPESLLRFSEALALLCLGILPISAQQIETSVAGSAGGLGAVEGIVRLAGDAAARSTLVENSTDPESCGTLHSLEDLVVADGSRGIQHVIIALIDVPAGAVPSSQPRQLVLENLDCRFEPHASVLRVGDVIRATNGDPLLHTVHYYGILNANLALSGEGASMSRTVRRPGMIIVKCDVHGWMQAFIRVDDHPFHAVTDDQGRFHIPDIPEGVYSIELWHEKLGFKRRTIRIEPARTAILEVEYSLDAP